MILSNKIKSQTHHYDDLPFDRNYVIEEKKTIEDGQEVTHFFRSTLPRKPNYDQTVSADLFSVSNMIAAGIPLGHDVGTYLNENAAQQYRSVVRNIAEVKSAITRDAAEIAKTEVQPEI